MVQLKFGIISEVKAGYAKIVFDEDEIVTDWWPVLHKTTLQDKESWPLNVNEHAACMCDERCEIGVVLGAIHNDQDTPDSGAGPGKFRKVFSDGTILEYDKVAHKLTADIKGSVKIDATQSIEATSVTTVTAKATISASIEAPMIELKGNVTVVGMLTAAGISAAPMPGVPGSTGKITAQADIETTGEIKASEVKAGTVALKTHTHSGVQTGGGTSGPPVA